MVDDNQNQTQQPSSNEKRASDSDPAANPNDGNPPVISSDVATPAAAETAPTSREAVSSKSEAAAPLPSAQAEMLFGSGVAGHGGTPSDAGPGNSNPSAVGNLAAAAAPPAVTDVAPPSVNPISTAGANVAAGKVELRGETSEKEAGTSALVSTGAGLSDGGDQKPSEIQTAGGAAGSNSLFPLFGQSASVPKEGATQVPPAKMFTFSDASHDRPGTFGLGGPSPASTAGISAGAPGALSDGAKGEPGKLFGQSSSGVADHASHAISTPAPAVKPSPSALSPSPFASAGNPSSAPSFSWAPVAGTFGQSSGASSSAGTPGFAFGSSFGSKPATLSSPSFGVPAPVSFGAGSGSKHVSFSTPQSFSKPKLLNPAAAVFNPSSTGVFGLQVTQPATTSASAQSAPTPSASLPGTATGSAPGFSFSGAAATATAPLFGSSTFGAPRVVPQANSGPDDKPVEKEAGAGESGTAPAFGVTGAAGVSDPKPGAHEVLPVSDVGVRGALSVAEEKADGVKKPALTGELSGSSAAASKPAGTNTDVRATKVDSSENPNASGAGGAGRPSSATGVVPVTAPEAAAPTRIPKAPAPGDSSERVLFSHNVSVSVFVKGPKKSSFRKRWARIVGRVVNGGRRGPGVELVEGKRSALFLAIGEDVLKVTRLKHSALGVVLTRMGSEAPRVSSWENPVKVAVTLDKEDDTVRFMTAINAARDGTPSNLGSSVSKQPGKEKQSDQLSSLRELALKGLKKPKKPAASTLKSAIRKPVSSKPKAGSDAQVRVVSDKSSGADTSGKSIVKPSLPGSDEGVVPIVRPTTESGNVSSVGPTGAGRMPTPASTAALTFSPPVTGGTPDANFSVGAMDPVEKDTRSANPKPKTAAVIPPPQQSGPSSGGEPQAGIQEPVPRVAPPISASTDPSVGSGDAAGTAALSTQSGGFPGAAKPSEGVLPAPSLSAPSAAFAPSVLSNSVSPGALGGSEAATIPDKAFLGTGSGSGGAQNIPSLSGAAETAAQATGGTQGTTSTFAAPTSGALFVVDAAPIAVSESPLTSTPSVPSVAGSALVPASASSPLLPSVAPSLAASATPAADPMPGDPSVVIGSDVKNKVTGPATAEGEMLTSSAAVPSSKHESDLSPSLGAPSHVMEGKPPGISVLGSSQPATSDVGEGPKMSAFVPVSGKAPLSLGGIKSITPAAVAGQVQNISPAEGGVASDTTSARVGTGGEALSTAQPVQSLKPDVSFASPVVGGKRSAAESVSSDGVQAEKKVRFAMDNIAGTKASQTSRSPAGDEGAVSSKGPLSSSPLAAGISGVAAPSAEPPSTSVILPNATPDTVGNQAGSASGSVPSDPVSTLRALKGAEGGAVERKDSSSLGKRVAPAHSKLPIVGKGGAAIPPSNWEVEKRRLLSLASEVPALKKKCLSLEGNVRDESAKVALAETQVLASEEKLSSALAEVAKQKSLFSSRCSDAKRTVELSKEKYREWIDIGSGKVRMECRPDSVDDFLDRLRTFRPSNWAAFDEVGRICPVECARHGWFCVRRNVISSTDGALVTFDSSALVRGGTEAHSSEVNRVREAITATGHQMCSPWIGTSCPEKFGSREIMPLSTEVLIENREVLKRCGVCGIEASDGMSGTLALESGDLDESSVLAAHHWSLAQLPSGLPALTCGWCRVAYLLPENDPACRSGEASTKLRVEHFSFCPVTKDAWKSNVALLRGSK